MVDHLHATSKEERLQEFRRLLSADPEVSLKQRR